MNEQLPNLNTTNFLAQFNSNFSKEWLGRIFTPVEWVLVLRLSWNRIYVSYQ
jgi:hypothetical protein